MDSKYQCRICSRMLKEPLLQCQTCFILSCRPCLTDLKYLMSENKCPNPVPCNGSLFLEPTPQSLEDLRHFKKKYPALVKEQENIQIGKSPTCPVCFSTYSNLQDHFLYRCLDLPQLCPFCRLPFRKHELDYHKHSECGEALLECRLCQTLFRRKFRHACRKNEEEPMSLDEKVRQLKDQVLREQLEVDRLKNEIGELKMQVSEREDDIYELNKENEDLQRRLDTAMAGGVVQGEEVPSGAINFDVNRIQYEEKLAYDLEHIAGIQCLIQLDPTHLELPSPGRCHPLYFLSGDKQGLIKLWDLDKKSSLRTFTFDPHKYEGFEGRGAPPIRGFIQFGTDAIVAIGHDHREGLLLKLDLKEMKEVLRINQAHTGEIKGLICYREQYIVSGADEQVKLWKADTFEYIHQNSFKQDCDSVQSLSSVKSEHFPDSFAMFTDTKRILILRFQLEPKKLLVLKEFKSSISAHTIFELMPDFLCCLSRGHIEVWSLGESKKRFQLNSPYGSIFDAFLYKFVPSRSQFFLLYSEDSKYLRICSSNQKVDWKVTTKHNDTITKLLKLKDMNLFVSGSEDGALKCHYGKRLPYTSLFDQ